MYEVTVGMTQWYVLYFTAMVINWGPKFESRWRQEVNYLNSIGGSRSNSF